MAIAFRDVNIFVPVGSGTKVLNGTAFFNDTSDVRAADVAIKGFRFDYTDGDHHINVIEVRAGVLSLTNNTVQVEVLCEYADQNFDDAYTGRILLLVMAEVA